MHIPHRILTLFVAALCVPATAAAQRHANGAAPPTAPHSTIQRAGAAPREIDPVSTGLGALEFASVSFAVPAPQSLTRQLQDSNERTRAAALAAIGAPGQYLTHGHIPLPHAVQLNFAALGAGDDLDAILTVQLDQHIVSAVLLGENGAWRRIATVIDPASFGDPTSTPSTFLHVERSLIQPSRFRAVYHASIAGQHGDLIENEADLRVLNDHAILTVSFASTARTCNTAQRTCRLTRRWLQADSVDPAHRFLMVTGTGWMDASDAGHALTRSPIFQAAHLRVFTCQPFVYSEASGHFEPTARVMPCSAVH